MAESPALFAALPWRRAIPATVTFGSGMFCASVTDPAWWQILLAMVAFLAFFIWTANWLSDWKEAK